MPERRKWSVFFERHGCLICVTRERIHVGNGMCGRCYNRTICTLKQIIAEQTTGKEAFASTRTLLSTSLEQPTTVSGAASATSRIVPSPSVGDGGQVPRGWNKRRKR
jgi:hypothetical protein